MPVQVFPHSHPDHLVPVRGYRLRSRTKAFQFSQVRSRNPDANLYRFSSARCPTAHSSNLTRTRPECRFKPLLIESLCDTL